MSQVLFQRAKPPITAVLLFFFLDLYCLCGQARVLHITTNPNFTFDISNEGTIVILQHSRLDIFSEAAIVSRQISHPLLTQYNFTTLKISPTGKIAALTSDEIGSVLVLALYGDFLVSEVPSATNSSSCTLSAPSQRLAPPVAWKDDLLLIWWPEQCAITSFSISTSESSTLLSGIEKLSQMTITNSGTDLILGFSELSEVQIYRYETVWSSYKNISSVLSLPFYSDGESIVLCDAGTGTIEYLFTSSSSSSSDYERTSLSVPSNLCAMQLVLANSTIFFYNEEDSMLYSYGEITPLTTSFPRQPLTVYRSSMFLSTNSSSVHITSSYLAISSKSDLFVASMESVTCDPFEPIYSLSANCSVTRAASTSYESSPILLAQSVSYGDAFALNITSNVSAVVPFDANTNSITVESRSGCINFRPLLLTFKPAPNSNTSFSFRLRSLKFANSSLSFDRSCLDFDPATIAVASNAYDWRMACQTDGVELTIFARSSNRPPSNCFLFSPQLRDKERMKNWPIFLAVVIVTGILVLMILFAVGIQQKLHYMNVAERKQKKIRLP